MQVLTKVINLGYFLLFTNDLNFSILIKNILFSLLVSNLFFNAQLYAQQGKVDTTFNTLDDGLNGDGFDNTVRTLSLQSDEKLIVGGEYLNLNGISAPYLTRLMSDGTIDGDFNTGSGFNGKVYASYVQSDGKIIVGGGFISYNGINSGRLIRLNSDGSYDATFNSSIGATTGIIYGICQQDDGKIIIVGSFTKYNNVTVNRIARILSNGALDTSFMTGSGSASNITNIDVLSNGKILLSGNFTVFNGVSANRIVRLFSDGRVDNGFRVDTGFNDDVNAMFVQSDGKIILGGKFTSYNEIVANRIIRIHEDGTPDTSFLSGSGLNNGAVQIIKADAFGNIMVGGSFTGLYNRYDVNRVFFIHPDGTAKTDFDIGSGPGSASVLALANGSDGSWYIGGSFSVFDGLNQGRLAKINGEGEYDTGYLSSGIGFDNSVLKVLPLDNKKTMIFGNFKKFNGVSMSRITRLLDDGMFDVTFNSEQPGANNTIKTAVLQADKKIVFAGNFTNYNGTVRNRIVRILSDGAIDETFNVGSGFNSQVYAMAIQPDEKIIVAGNFTSYKGSSVGVGRIVRLLPDGSRDTNFYVGLGADAIIEAILIQPDGKILVAGRFNNFDGHPFSRLVRLNADGSIDSGFVIASGFDKIVYAIALQSDGKIILGGTFLTYNGISQKRIIRLNSNGYLDATFDSGNGFANGDVRSILIQPDDRILVGGTFTGSYKSHTSLRLIRLLKNGSYDPSFEANLNNKLYTMGFTSDYKLLIGGDFNSISGVSKHRIARLKLCLDLTVWDGVGWSNGFPSGGKELTFKEDYTTLSTSSVCSCSIDEGKKVTLLSGHTLALEFNYFGSGTLVLENSASLYQYDDEITNTGIVHVKRKSSPILKSDYTYWSSPVEDQKLVDVSPNTLGDKYFSYDYAVRNWRMENPSNKMIVGKGYIIRGPQEFSTNVPASFEAIFKGIPNNGKIDLILGDIKSFNLIGNPYPSALNADVFLIENASKINGTLSFWTHNTPINNNKYASDDYAVYNLLGGVGTSGALASGVNETIPDGTIASGQAFLVQSKGAGNIEFNNGMRLEKRNSTFFKPGKSGKESGGISIEKHRIWLNFKNSEGIFKQILIGYIKGATNSYDDSYDAETVNGNQFADFYSTNENKKLVIQGRALPFVDTDVVPLGYKTTVAGDFTISIDAVDGKMSNQAIYLEDKTTGEIHDLRAGNYTFNTAVGTFLDRLVLRYTGKTLGTGDFENLENGILVTVKNKVINVLSPKENIKEVTIFDVSGKLFYSKKKIGNTELQIPNLPSGDQVLLVKVTLENNFTTTKKVIF